MIFPNNNKAIIKKLTKRTLKAGKLRNIMVILAIVLTTTLFTSLFTIGMSISETMQQQTMRQAGGYAHGTLKSLIEEEFADLKTHPLIKRLGYSILLGMGENKELLKRHTEIRYATNDDAKMRFSFPSSGRMPRKENELATDTLVLDLLGIPHEIGESLSIEYSINGKIYVKEFILSGFWENETVSPASMVYVSEQFVLKALAGIDQKKEKNGIGVGLIFADVMFKNSWNIEKNMHTVITESGYSIDKGSPNYIPYGVNWSYLSTNFKPDLTSIIVVLAASALIIFTGYLIIYNIFQISVVRDIRFYGLLKTIGTTPKQIRKIIRNQAFLLSIVGIPLGLLSGFFLGVVLLPVIMQISTYENSYVSFSPLIFMGAAVFTLITVWFSSRKPEKIAGGVSPVEALRYTEQEFGKKKSSKKSRDKGIIYRMAFSNLTRNKKKTGIVVISMSLSLILLSSVFTLTNGFSMDKFLSRFLTTDFIIGHANYFNNNHFRTKTDEVSQSLIEALNVQEGIEGAGKIYYNIKKINVSYEGRPRELQLYGMEDFPLTQLNIVAGELDLAKLKTGKYIIEGVYSDDNGKIQWERSNYDIGDKVTVTMAGGISKEYEVLAKAEIVNGFSVRYYNLAGDTMYLPASEFSNLVQDPVTMNYVINVNDKYTDAVESFLYNYTNRIESAMDYESKKVFADEFMIIQNMFLTVGGTLSLIIGIIGILNFINSIVTGIIARRREFAILQSIGTTYRQLRKLLMLEGLFYALSTIVITLVAGSFFSFVVIQSLARNLWFFSYHFTILPLLLSSPLLILISMAIPVIAYRGTNRHSIIERLRETE